MEGKEAGEMSGVFFVHALPALLKRIEKTFEAVAVGHFAGSLLTLPNLFRVFSVLAEQFDKPLQAVRTSEFRDRNLIEIVERLFALTFFVEEVGVELYPLPTERLELDSA